MVDLNAIISSTLAENTHVWVVLKGTHGYLKYFRGFGSNGYGYEIATTIT